jgi:pimeloyl-ACP methyl ester carboxylesterase
MRWGQLHYRQCGEGGVPLVLLHQSGNSSRMWTNVMEQFGARRRTVALDLPGFGMSDPPPERRPLVEYAHAVVEALDALGIGKPIFGGFHTGAALSIALATRHANRVEKIVLIGVPRFDPNDTTPPEVRWADTMPDEAGEYLGRAWKRLGIPDLAIRNREMADRLLAGEYYLYGSAAVRSFDVWGSLPKIACPALLVAATGDTMFSGQADATALIPDARFVPIEGNTMIADFSTDEFVRLVEEFAG